MARVGAGTISTRDQVNLWLLTKDVQLARSSGASSLTSHFRISVRCGKCGVPKPIAVTHGRYEKVWGLDWVTIFERVRFRCRCGALADALKVERHTPDRPEEVLFVQVQTGYTCGHPI